MPTKPVFSSVIASRAPVGLHGLKGGRSAIGAAAFGLDFFSPLAGSDPPAVAPARAPAIGLRLETALGFTKSGSKSLLFAPAAAAFCARCSGDGRGGSAITSTSSEVSARRAGKRREVIELLKSASAPEPEAMLAGESGHER